MPEVQPNSDLALSEYRETGKPLLKLVRMEINLYIDTLVWSLIGFLFFDMNVFQALKENKHSNELVQLSHWLYYIIMKLNYYMKRRKDDSGFMLGIIERLTE